MKNGKYGIFVDYGKVFYFYNDHWSMIYNCSVQLHCLVMPLLFSLLLHLFAGFNTKAALTLPDYTQRENELAKSNSNKYLQEKIPIEVLYLSQLLVDPAKFFSQSWIETAHNYFENFHYF